jgi:hypothetical protein
MDYDVRAQLERMIADPNMAANARASAARTRAEMDGHIGRHQQAPDRTLSAPVAGLSRADLVAELERLRALCGQNHPGQDLKASPDPAAKRSRSPRLQRPV